MPRLRMYVITLSVVLFCSPWTFAQAPPAKTPQQFHPAMLGQPIAGIPHDEALKIFDRHIHELHKLPGTISVSFTAEGLVVRTANPETLPSTVEGLPVFAIPPIDPNAVGALQKGLPPRSAPPPTIPPQVVGGPVPPAPHGVLCAPGYTADPASEKCINNKNEPEPLPPQPEAVNPPPGVIVLRPGKIREQAEKCPETFKEVEGYNNWRFCVDPNKPEPIPPLWSPPIAGIPFEKALEIHARRVLELRTLPGIESVGLGADGIHVYTSKPEVVPKEVEGLPIKVFPATGLPFSNLTHTYTTPVRPLHGAVAATPAIPIGWGTLTGIVLADGKPWVVLPTHLLPTCTSPPPCQAQLPLNQCPHYNTGVQPLLIQPVTGGVNDTIGWAQRWTPLSLNFYSADVAAAFVDSDFQDSNGSLSADQKVHDQNNGIPIVGATIPAFPILNSTVRLRSSVDPHTMLLTLKATNVSVPF